MANEITRAIMANLSVKEKSPNPLDSGTSRLSAQESRLLADMIHRGTSVGNVENKSDHAGFKEEKFHTTGLTLDELAKLK